MKFLRVLISGQIKRQTERNISYDIKLSETKKNDESSFLRNWPLSENMTFRIRNEKSSILELK